MKQPVKQVHPKLVLDGYSEQNQKQVLKSLKPPIQPPTKPKAHSQLNPTPPNHRIRPLLGVQPLPKEPDGVAWAQRTEAAQARAEQGQTTQATTASGADP